MANVREVVFSSESSGQLWNACVWDPRAGTTLMTYKNGIAAPHSMCLLGNDYLLSSEPGKPIVRAWALNKHEQTQLRMICPGPVHALACSPDGIFLAAGVLEALYVWQTATGHLLATVKAHYQPISCLSFTDDSAFLVSGSEDCQVLVWDMLQLVSKTSLGDSSVVSEATPRHSFNHHTLPVLDVFVGKGGVQAFMASVSMDQSCKIYSLSSGSLLLNIVFTVGLTSVTMDVVNSEVFLGAADGKIFSYRLHNAPRTSDFHIPSEYPAVFKGHDQAVTCLSVSIDSTLLVSGSLDEKAIIWDVVSRQMLRILPHKGPVTNIFFTIAPKNVFSEELKPSFVLKNLLRHSGSEGDKEIEVITHAVNGMPRPTRLQQQLFQMQEMLERGEVPPMFCPQGSEGLSEELHNLKTINAGLYKFAMEELLKPQEGDPQPEDVPVIQSRKLHILSKKSKKKRKLSLPSECS